MENCLNRDINRIKRKASRIVTLLPENALTPIPKKDVNTGLANRYDKKELNDAQRTAVFIRRMEYSTKTKRKMDEDNKLKNKAKKIALIQQWWKTMYKIIKLQKNIRGFLFRKKLMNNLEHQEKLLQFITEFDNIHTYHLYKQFLDNLKGKRDYEKAKLMEKCEDFNEKLDNLEKLHNHNNFKNCFKKWKDKTKQKKKENLDNLANKLKDILKNKEDEDKKDALKQIKDDIKDQEEKLNDKIKNFQENQAKKKFINDLVKAHRLNKILNNIKNILDEKNKKDALDKLKHDNDIAKTLNNLNKLLNDKIKKDTLDDLKTMNFVNKLDNLINNHNNKVNNDAKKDLIDKLKDIKNKKQLKDALNKWKNFNDELKNRNKILNKLRRHKLNEIRKKEEEEKNKLAISSGVNDFELISDKKDEEKKPNMNNQIFISNQNDINILAEPAPKLVLSHASQNFSLHPQELDKFEFYEPFHKNKNLDKTTIPNQLNNIDSFLENKLIKQQEEKKNNLENLIKKLNDVYTNAKKENDDKLKKDAFDKIKKDSDIVKGIKLLEDFLNKKPKKEALNALKKNSGISEGFRKLDKLIKNKVNKDVMDKLKKNSDNQKVLEDLDKLLLDKYKKQLLENLKDNRDLTKFVNSLENYVKKCAKSQLLENLKKKDNLRKIIEKIDKKLTNKLKRKFLNGMKKDNDIKKAFDKLDKFTKNKLKKDALDTLKKNSDLQKAIEKLEKLIKDKNDKTKKEGLDTLKQNSNLQKAIEKVDKLIKDKNDKTKKDTFDELKKNDDIIKTINKVDKILNSKLKDDTFKKLKTIDFVDILKKMKKKKEDNNKNEKIKNLLNNLKKIQNNGKEEEKNKLKNALDHWKNIKEDREILDSFKNLRNIKKQKQLQNTIKNINDNKKNNNLKEYFDRWKENAINSYKSKRISHRRSPKKYRNKSKGKKNNDKKLLKDAFDKWKKISSFAPTRDVLEHIKKNKSLNDNVKNKDIFQKYKKKVLQNLSNIYKNQKDTLLKKYFNKWRNILRSPKEKDEKEILKYKKKPKIYNSDDLENNDSNLDKNSFRPKYYFQKRNLHNRITPLFTNPIFFLNDKINPHVYNRTNYNPESTIYQPRVLKTEKNNKVPYKKKYVQRTLDFDSSQNQEEINNNEEEDEIPKDKEIHLNNNLNLELSNIKEKDNEQFEETSSNNESLLSGILLIQNKKVIKQPRNYTSQSFFIDKNAVNVFNKNKANNNTNQLPMTMKGDFVSLIEQNPKILSQKNPRIQVTNSTCDLKQIINEHSNERSLNGEEINNEINNLNNNYILDKNKVLNKVVQNCDQDLYSTNKNPNSKNDQWYSVSIPLNDNEAKWEFLNNIKGERDKNNLNKFELIQKEANPKRDDKKDQSNNTRTFKPPNTDKRQKKINEDASYKLPEMNYSQFYRSPIRPRKMNEEEKSILPATIIKKPAKRKIIHGSHSFLDISNPIGEKNKNKKNVNISRSRGNIRFDPRFKSIEYDDEYNYSDE